MNWDEWALSICDAVAGRSKDQSTQLGAVILGPDHEALSFGYNSFPRGIIDGVLARQKRPEKYKWFVHAEANAIYGAARAGTALKGGTIYCQWLPCPNCAMGIIQAGLIQVVVKSLTVPERWVADMTISTVMLQEAGVNVRQAQ